MIGSTCISDNIKSKSVTNFSKCSDSTFREKSNGLMTFRLLYKDHKFRDGDDFGDLHFITVINNNSKIKSWVLFNSGSHISSNTSLRTVTSAIARYPFTPGWREASLD